MEESGPDLIIQQGDDIRVIHIGGSLIDRISVEQVGDRIMREIESTEAGPKVVICFDKIKEVSSAILGAVLKIEKQVRLRDGSLKLAGMQPNVKEVFHLTRLDTILEIHESAQEAVQSFGA